MVSDIKSLFRGNRHILMFPFESALRMTTITNLAVAQ